MKSKCLTYEESTHFNECFSTPSYLNNLTVNININIKEIRGFTDTNVLDTYLSNSLILRM